MTQTLEEFMWTNRYEERAKALADDRKSETVVALKQLIVDMFSSGYTPNRIAKLLGKDHTTIYYHLGALSKHKPPKVSNPEFQVIGLEVRLEQAKNKREKRLSAMSLNKKLREEKKKLKELVRFEKAELERERLKENLELHKQVAERRERGIALYKKGLPYRQIAIELGVSPNYIQSLIQGHPDYKGARRKVAYNRRREVLQYDMKGNLIATHQHLREAAAAVDGHSHTISLVARGIAPTHKGFVWRYGKTIDPLKFKL